MLTKNCDQCGKTFSSQRSLKDHRYHVHPKRVFQCYHCKHISKSKDHLSSHMNVHFKTRNSVNRLLCPMCSHVACDRLSMLSHYEQVHDVSLAPKKLKFKTYDEFLSWKSALENTDQCSYVPVGGPNRTINKTSRRFKCFRSGFFSSKGKGKRRMKIRGSCKINGICPAKISCTEDRRTGEVDASYIAAHVGHETDVGLLKLTKDQKDDIARKIAAQVPFHVILDDMREAGMKDKMDRSILVTRKDLWNIHRDYNLNKDGKVRANDSEHIHKDLNMLLEGQDQELSTGLNDGLLGMFELEIVESSPNFPPSRLNDLTNHRSQPNTDDIDKAKEELTKEWEQIMLAVTCPAHVDVVRRNIRPSLSMIEAINDGLRYKNSMTINPCSHFSPQKTLTFF